MDQEDPSFSKLEQRVAEIEDRLAILNLIASHPLSADTGIGAFIKTIYAADAEFDRGALFGAKGIEALMAFGEKPEHKTALDGGLAHFGNLPFIELDGDEAVATSYIMLVTFDRDARERNLANHGSSKGHSIFRVVANRWSLVRTPDGWRVRKRNTFPMDGSAPARDLLAETVKKYV